MHTVLHSHALLEQVHTPKEKEKKFLHLAALERKFFQTIVFHSRNSAFLAFYLAEPNVYFLSGGRMKRNWQRNSGLEKSKLRREAENPLTGHITVACNRSTLLSIAAVVVGSPKQTVLLWFPLVFPSSAQLTRIPLRVLFKYDANGQVTTCSWVRNPEAFSGFARR